MNFLKSRTSTATPEPAAAPVATKVPVLEGWSESELVDVYNAAPVRHLRKGETVFADAPSTNSFFVLLEGSIQIVVKWDNHKGRPGIIWRGDCVAPLPKAPGLLYCADAIEQSTIIEITPTVLNYLPAKTQLAIYKVAITATSRINAYIRSVNGEVDAKNARMASYMKSVIEDRNHAADTEQVKN